MRRFILPCLLLLALPACRERAPKPTTGESSPPPARPVADPRAEMLGDWTVDVARLPEQANFREMPAQQRALALEMAENLLASMTVRFTEHGYAITTGGKTVEGTWRIVSQRAGTLTLELYETPPEGGEAIPAEQMVVQVDTRGLLMKAAEDEALPLRRKVDPNSQAKP